jgi:HTH-type transcriptional regulator / antitoxin HigA
MTDDQIRSIRTDDDLDHAIEVIDSLLDLPFRSASEEEYLQALSDLVEAYEDEHVVIPETTNEYDDTP